jgi:hypothetical protein
MRSGALPLTVQYAGVAGYQVCAGSLNGSRDLSLSAARPAEVPFAKLGLRTPRTDGILFRLLAPAHGGRYRWPSFLALPPPICRIGSKGKNVE